MKNFYISAVRSLVVGALSFLTAIPVHATFPGKNGKIAFIQDGEVFTMNPDEATSNSLPTLLQTTQQTSPPGRQTANRSYSMSLRHPTEFRRSGS